MEILSKRPAAESYRYKPSRSSPAPSRMVSDTFSQSSYKTYPANRCSVNTPARHTPQTFTRHSYRPASPSKAFPESSGAAILSALRNLQEKIRRLELEKERAELSLCTLLKDGRLQSDSPAQRLLTEEDEDIDRKTSEQSNHKEVLITHLAAAENRCEKLEGQLEQMKRMLPRTERTNSPNQEVNSVALTERPGTSGQQPDGLSELAQLEKLEKLEQEYLRLTRTQENAAMKIGALERKIQEEEHHRRLIQDKANQLQTSMEANRMLLQSVSPRFSFRQSKEKKSSSKQPSPKHTEPHYRLSLRDIPFVTGTSVACSHSVRANVQAVLSLLKRHQPHLCNKRVLSHNADHSETSSQSDTSSSSSSSSTCGDELLELLQALQEELYLMSLEHSELMKQMEESASEKERGALQRDQDRLLLRMESKEEQISKLCKHKSQIKKLRKKLKSEKNSRAEERLATRGRSEAPTKAQLAERNKRNLTLLRDMRALQNSLQT
ncbi:PREDICTED: centrosomal protein of 57 kDa isoform X1 [Poecilia mexicana]|uniref:Centrosomal protein 57 n=1 Tax=Poecilia mexicana TaxID=48701 RepID=A0A3B3X9T2_9TELE|nr:PREDICTED: centrosomal protein of 57 kDa isoform X1 [Poecilia mexicana]